MQIGSVHGCSGNQLFSIQSEIAFIMKEKELELYIFRLDFSNRIFHYGLDDNHKLMQDVYAQIQNPFCQVPGLLNFSL